MKNANGKWIHKNISNLIKINKKQSKNIIYSSIASTKDKWCIMPKEVWQMDIHLFMVKIYAKTLLEGNQVVVIWLTMYL